MSDSVRVRIAPSPTGKFHVGTARTALFNYLFAKKYEGMFIVRIEDTDKERSNDLFTKDILEGLLWLGMAWDEGPEVGGPFGPYFQQERQPMYQKYLDALLEKKLAYRCYCTREELETERAAQQAKNQPPKYSGKCRHLTAQEIDRYEREGRESVVRFIVEPQTVTFTDMIRGKIETDASLFGDFVIVRSDGMPLFTFSNVIDDHEMAISHVLRGEEHLPNTARQILLAQAMNILSPEFGHFPLILNPDRSKMSKRKDPVSVTEDFRDKGFLPEALINFIALLGWSSGTDREIFSMHDLISEFQIERVGKSPSIFDREKLLWMNGHYIRTSQVGYIASSAKQFITNKKILAQTERDPEYFLSVVAAIQDRLKTLVEIEPLIEFFYEKPNYKADLLILKKSTKARTALALKLAEEALTKLKAMAFDETDLALRSAAQNHDLKPGEILWPVRVALTGQTASPGTFEMLEILGKKESLERIATARKKLTSLKK